VFHSTVWYYDETLYMWVSSDDNKFSFVFRVQHPAFLCTLQQSNGHYYHGWKQQRKHTCLHLWTFYASHGEIKPKDVRKIITDPSVTEIPHEAFRECRQIESVTLHERVKIIGRSSFFKCPNLTDINVEESSLIIIDILSFSVPH